MENEIDLLREKISSAKKITPEKIDAMNQLTALLRTTDAKSADETAHRAMIEARSIEYKKGEADALVNAGLIASAQRHFSDAGDFYKRALKIFEREDDETQIANVLHKLGNICLFEGKYPEALEYYNRAFPIREKLNDELGTADLHANSAAILGLQGSYSLALQSHLKALKIFEKKNESARIASASTNIGLIHKEQHHYEEALKMFNDALKIREQKNDWKAVSDLLNNIGNVYQEKKEFPEALRYHERALELREQIEDKTGIAYSFSNLGNIWQAKRDNNKALDYYLKSLVLFRAINEKCGLLQSYNNLGELYYEMENYEDAHRYLNLAIQLAEETGLKNQMRKAVEFSSETFAREERFKEAYQMHVRYTQLDKEISNLETHKEIAQMSVRHEMEQKERLAEIEREKNAELTKAYNALDTEKQRSENLLLNILPEEVADELKQNGKATAKYFDNVTVFFSDFVGFTKVSMILTPQELVDELHACFSGFDEIISKYQIEKIKTVGDAYMAASGLPLPNENHAADILKAAIEIRNFMLERKKVLGEKTFEVRIGIHSGSVVAGIVGVTKFAYDIWGDTVNTAARMEQNSVPGKINISENTYEILAKTVDKHKFEYRGEIEAKNKGKLKMYFAE